MHELNHLSATFLGLVQGITEFLPISSSGHLVVLQQWLGLNLPDEQLVALDVCLHFGSLLAILLVFWREVWLLFRRPRLIGLILLGSVPAALVGIGFEEKISTLFSSVKMVGWMWIFTGIILFATRNHQAGTTDRSRLSVKQALLIGLAQALAIIPGISRSGSTIAAGQLTGLERNFSGEFAFLLALPAIGGAVLLKSDVILNFPTDMTGPLVLGTGVSLVASYLSLRLLLQFVRHGRLSWFAYYCWGIGMVSLLATSLK